MKSPRERGRTAEQLRATFPAYNARMDENPYKAPATPGSIPVPKRRNVGKWVSVATGGLIGVAMALPLVQFGGTVPPLAAVQGFMLLVSIGFVVGGLLGSLFHSLLTWIFYPWD
jgi:hypothetical protein